MTMIALEEAATTLAELAARVEGGETIVVTRDPFDRLLLAQCAIEGRRLVTIDAALRDHPLAAGFDKS